MKSIRAVLVVLTVSSLTAIDAGPAAAEVYRPWCVQYFRGTNCGFTSYEQCRMTATPGSGGYCVQNPWYLWYGAGGQKPQRTRRY